MVNNKSNMKIVQNEIVIEEVDLKYLNFWIVEKKRGHPYSIHFKVRKKLI